MKQEKDYIQDIADIRSMMERSSRFMSLSGWAGIIAGIFALSGSYIAFAVYGFNPDELIYNHPNLEEVVFLALAVLILAIGTATILSSRKAKSRGEKIWNSSARRLTINMAIPLVTGGLLILILIFHGLIGLIAPFTLLFYGLAIYNASKFTYEEMKILGLIQAGLGLIGSYYIDYGLILWAIGFGLVHIVYGIYMHYKFEK